MYSQRKHTHTQKKPQHSPTVPEYVPAGHAAQTLKLAPPANGEKSKP